MSLVVLISDLLDQSAAFIFLDGSRVSECFLDKAAVFVGSSIVVPPVFPFFSTCLPCPFGVVVVVVFFWGGGVVFFFSPFFFSFFFFCIYYEFILAEDLCVHFPLLLISLSFSGGFLVKAVFPLF